MPERPFIAKEYPIGHKDDPFEKSKIESQIQERLSKRTYPDQNGASLCGPAAFFYCLQMDRPDIYEQAARELWRYGKTKIGELEIKPGDGCRHPKGSFCNQYGERISGLDWLTLASLRDSENTIMNYDEISDQVAGITMWEKLTEWFEKAGYEKVFDNISVFSHSNVNDIINLNQYIKKGYRVVSLISAGMLDSITGDTSMKNHWVVWEGEVSSKGIPINSNEINNDNMVNLNMFSWGKIYQQVKGGNNLNYFLKHTFGGLVFKPIK
ncbi:transposase [Xenorhabdus beddingii]|uniref:Transposase n=1 Tax=Xenorhabdus beddingii TaxID=40578 RepID=A0A1Y2S8A6_9GAMM|nr:transposase [Xenorhabdus beddingii]